MGTSTNLNEPRAPVPFLAEQQYPRSSATGVANGTFSGGYPAPPNRLKQTKSGKPNRTMLKISEESFGGDIEYFADCMAQAFYGEGWIPPYKTYCSTEEQQIAEEFTRNTVFDI